MADLQIEIRWKRKRVARAGLARLVRQVLAGEGRAGAAVSLVLADDALLHQLNRDFRGIDRPTDVLAFPAAPEDSDLPGYLGDVVVSAERAEAQAPRFQGTLEEELARLVIHGLLHLLGHDHHSPAEGRRMKARERLYLAGVAPGTLVPRA